MDMSLFNPDQTREQINSYSDGIRLIMLTHRSKEGGPNNNPDHAARKWISTNKEEYEAIVETALLEMDKSDVPLRLYASVNARDIGKGVYEFKRKQLDAEYQGEPYNRNFYLDIKNQFYSALAKPGSRAAGENYFIFDIDSEEEFHRFNLKSGELPTTVVSKFRTKNGYHVVTMPFNPSLASGFEIKKDGLLLLAW